MKYIITIISALTLIVMLQAQMTTVVSNRGGAAPPPAGGIELDATSVGTSTSSPATISHTTGSGSNRFLVVCVNTYHSSDPDITGITYNSVPLTQAINNPLSGTTEDMDIWYLVAPSTGTNNISISGTFEEVASVVSTWTGVDQSTPIGETGLDDGTNPSYAITVDAGDIVVGGVCSYTGTITLGADQVLLNTATGAGDGTDAVSDYEPSPSGGSVTMSYTHTASGNFTGAAGVEVNVAP